MKNNKAKLSIFVYSLGGGGAEKAAIELIVGLNKNFDIKLLLFSDIVKYKLPDNIAYEVLDSFDFYDNPIKKLLKLPWLAYKYAAFCKKHDINISLSLLSRPNIISVASRFFGNKAEIVLSEHSTLSHYYGNSVPEIVMKKIISVLYKKSNKIIAVSNGAKSDMVENFSVSSEKIHVLHNPIDINLIVSRSHEAVKIDMSKFTFITCGRLIKSKNVEMVILAFAKQQDLNTQLIILGEGEQEQELKEICEKYAISERVFFLGFTQNPYAYFSKSSVFVFGSNLEALPTVLIEALACNLPIISTDCPSGPSEILCDDNAFFADGIKYAKYGLLVKVGDTSSFSNAMKIMSENTILRENFSKIAYQRAIDFEKEKIFEKYTEVLLSDEKLS